MLACTGDTIALLLETAPKILRPFFNLIEELQVS
jgi:hypothetical protein